MDVPPVAGTSPDPREPSVPGPPVGAGLRDPNAVSGPDINRRLATVEAGLAELGERLDGLAASLEESLRAAVAEEVRTASADLRHTVSELGRLLVRDLGRLSKILAEHRDSIVADLRPAAPQTPAAQTGEALLREDAAPAEVDDVPAPPADEAEDPEPAEPAEPAGPADVADPAERQRRTLLRRRQA